MSKENPFYLLDELKMIRVKNKETLFALEMLKQSLEYAQEKLSKIVTLSRRINP